MFSFVMHDQIPADSEVICLKSCVPPRKLCVPVSQTSVVFHPFRFTSANNHTDNALVYRGARLCEQQVTMAASSGDEVAALDRIMTRVALTKEDQLEQVSRANQIFRCDVPSPTARNALR